MPEHGLPWKRGIGNDACKIWDKDGHLVCELESSSDSTFLVECVNEYPRLKKATDALSAKDARLIADALNLLAVEWVRQFAGKGAKFLQAYADAREGIESNV